MNTAESKFAKFTSGVQTSGQEYPLEMITGIPVHSIISTTDQACPDNSNLERLEKIPGLTKTILSNGWDHLDMLNNEAAYLSRLYFNMPQLAIPVSDPLICPAIPVPPEPEPTPDPVDPEDGGDSHDEMFWIWIIIALGVLILIALFFAIYYCMQSKKKDKWAAIQYSNTPENDGDLIEKDVEKHAY